MIIERRTWPTVTVMASSRIGNKITVGKHLIHIWRGVSGDKIVILMHYSRNEGDASHLIPEAKLESNNSPDALYSIKGYFR